MTDPTTPPAGWYDDGSGAMRYWDGSAWTEHTAPKAEAPHAPADAAPAEDAGGAGAGAAETHETAATPETAGTADTAGTPDTPGPADTAGHAASNSPGFAPVEPTASSVGAPTQVYGAAAVATAPQSDSAFAPAPGAVGAKPHVLGIIALAVAVIGFIFACIPGALIVGWILLPIAFILSIVALFLKGQKWPAIAGLAVSIVGTIVGVVVFFAVVATSFEEAFAPVEGSGGGSAAIEDADAAEEPAADDAPAPEPVGNLAFGDAMMWEDGVEMTVTAPEPFTPTEFAAGADQAHHLLFTFTITNNSTENLEPLIYNRLSSGGQESSQIFDFDNPAGDVSSYPTTVILPGQSVTWLEAWSVADPASLTMQVAPNWDYEDAIFTTVQ